jgi:hypothetical protein
VSGLAIAGLTVAESDFLGHVTRFGSDGYPVHKCRNGRWIWADFWGVKGAPTTYRTKRDCVQAIERYIDVLLDKHAGRL